MSLAPPIVRVESLTRRFTLKGVLNGVDLEIAQGEFVALLGRSGCGKSTLLRAIAGIDHEAEGEGRIKRPDRTAVVFQDARLLPWKRVIDNVALGLDGGFPLVRARQALDEVELQGREDAWPHELSGGEQQRVALARALVHEPQLLLADEPFGALDALTRLRMHALLQRLVGAHRPAVLLVTHDIDEALALADRVVLLDGGRVSTQLGVGDQVRRQPSELARARRALLSMLGVGEFADLHPA